MRSREEVTGFFDGFEILDPGIVPMPRWRPEPDPALEVSGSGAGIPEGPDEDEEPFTFAGF
ncbi:SAM-dependent methyltransferase, partial [Streptomyces sp. 12297]